MAKPRRAAVIGSGFGGLAVAIRLQAAGFATTIFEGQKTPGGRAFVIREQGYTFDGGPTVVTAPPCFEELFELAGQRLADHVELIPVDPFYRLIWSDGDRFAFNGDGAAMAAQIEARSPADVAGYRAFVEYSKKVFATGYEQLAATPFLSFADMLKVAPNMLQLRADRSVYATIAKYVRDEKIRQALSFHTLLVGGNPFDTSAIYTLIHYLERKWGVTYPRGGMSALIGALVKLYTGLGGELRLSCPVDQVEVDQTAAGPRHQVTSEAGDKEPFDLVVSNADVHHTYARLFREHPWAQRYTRKLERSRWSMSVFVLYFGTDRSYQDQVVQHSVLFAARYKALLREIFSGPKLPDDFSLYLHAPHVTDPGMAPPGCGSFYALSPVPHLGNAELDWETLGAEYAERILTALEVILPDLRRHVVLKRWITPRTFESTMHAFRGSAFSFAPVLTQSAYFRPHNRDDHIPGLYLVGAGTHPGAGLPGVVSSAKATARLIEQDYAPQ